MQSQGGLLPLVMSCVSINYQLGNSRGNLQGGFGEKSVLLNLLVFCEQLCNLSTGFSHVLFGTVFLAPRTDRGHLYNRF